GFEKAGLEHKLVHVFDVEEGMDYLKGLSPFSDRGKYPFPDLVMLDIKIPRESGFDMLRRLRFHDELRALPVVMVSNSALKGDVETARSLGAREFFTKPSGIKEYQEIALGLDKRWLQPKTKP